MRKKLRASFQARQRLPQLRVPEPAGQAVERNRFVAHREVPELHQQQQLQRGREERHRLCRRSHATHQRDAVVGVGESAVT